MIPVEHDIVCQRGCTFRMQIQVLNPDNTAIDLTGYAAAMAVGTQNNVLFTLDQVNGLTMGVGTIDVVIGEEQTLLLTGTEYKYNIKVHGGDTFCLMRGAVIAEALL